VSFINTLMNYFATFLFTVTGKINHKSPVGNNNSTNSAFYQYTCVIIIVAESGIVA